ncbi:MAG: hypothetical protein JWP63_3566 [Candidatus Solibacter sp.]|jgi:hypothetical protein|nr:hypothetical protein [Candidatus Solibacter sp.]
MTASAAKDPRQALGRNPDRLTLEERMALAGKFIALEIYTPETLPLRRIEAIGNSMEECVKMLQSRGLNPRQFEFSMISWPY